MGFVAVGKWLRGRSAAGNIIGNFLFHGLLRIPGDCHKKQRRRGQGRPRQHNLTHQGHPPLRFLADNGFEASTKVFQ
jgi:hypothetical protein